MAKKKKTKTSKKVMRQRITKACKELKADAIKAELIRKTKAKRKATPHREQVNEPRIVVKLRNQATVVNELGFANGKLNRRRDMLVIQINKFADAIVKSFDVDDKKRVRDVDKAERYTVRAKRRAEIDAKRHIRDEAKQKRHDEKMRKKRDKLIALRFAADKLAKEIGE